MTATAVERRHPHDGDESYQSLFLQILDHGLSEGVKTACEDRWSQRQM